MVRFAAALALIALPAAASANCDHLVRKGSTAKGDALITTYRSLLKCDKDKAETAYVDFLKQTGDVPTMVQLSLAAIDHQTFKPVWDSLERLKDYTARDEAATAIGAACGEHPEVVVFLKGAYFGLKNIQFSQWDDAFIACQSEDIQGWLHERVQDPPAMSFDEKYNTILSIWVKRNGAQALPALKAAAITAAEKDGPFVALLESMDQAIQPEAYGKDPDPAHVEELRKSLVDLAEKVGPERASQVADRLFNTGAEAQAASLLPRVYPDRVQSGGSMLYGVASVESCDDQVVLHFAEVHEPSTRWSVQADVETPARAFKPRLKCKSDQPWPVLITPEPVSNSKEIGAWVDTLVPQWESQGMSVKTRSQSKIELPARK